MPKLKRHPNLDRYLKDHGAPGFFKKDTLTATEYKIFEAIPRGGIRPKELAGMVGLNPSSMSHPLANMEAKGAIVRAAHPTDARGAIIVRSGDKVDKKRFGFKPPTFRERQFLEFAKANGGRAYVKDIRDKHKLELAYACRTAHMIGQKGFARVWHEKKPHGLCIEYIRGLDG